MKKLIGLVITAFIVNCSIAQYVEIPDTAFRNKLMLLYPSCFNGAGQMDTTCSAIINEDSLTLGYTIPQDGSSPIQGHIADIEGIQYFKNLLQFDCSYYSIISIPSLPQALKDFNCSHNMLSALPSLPGALTSFDCSNNQLTSLPYLPPTLTTFSCERNQLTALPVLPQRLKTFSCKYNMIEGTVVLPDSAFFVLLTSNRITSLGSSLPQNLYVLYCDGNQLTGLPPLPNSLGVLDCSRNTLTSLPTIPPYIHLLDCYSNNIYCFPAIQYIAGQSPNTLLIGFDNLKIGCFPNMPPNVGVTLMEDPFSHYPEICSPVNNINHCERFPLVTGKVFCDINNNSIKDVNESYKTNVEIHLTNGRSVYSDNSGYYQAGTDSLGTYTVSIVVPDHFIIPSSSTATYTFTSYDTLVTTDFALQPNASVDELAVDIIPINWAARPAFSFAYMISYENTGTTTLSPNIIFDYDETRLDYNSSSVTGVVDNINTLNYSSGPLVPGERGSFIGYFTLKTNVLLGDSLNAKATIHANAFNAYDSTLTIVRGAFDPNDKQATPQLSPTQVANGDYIDYTIRFQNTGTDTAFNVVISDTLSSLLQANSLQMIASSHNCKTTVKNNIVFFELLNILLPDSNVNEAKSHGFVSFKIKPQNNVSVNSTINNKAAIYFDYNAPVITNTASTLIKEFITVPLKLVSFSAVPQTDRTTTLYWNTANEINSNYFVIESGTDGMRFKSITTVTAKGMANNSYTSTVADNNTGIAFYRLKMVDKDGRFTYSPIIKIDRSKNTPGFSILSNPVKDMLIISSNDATLHNSTALIINSTGAVVKSFVVKDGTQTIDIHSLPPGVYYIRSNSGSQKLLIR